MTDLSPEVVGWEPGAFTAMFQDAPGKEPRKVSIAGWIKHPFALDFRVYLDHDGDEYRGWRITHIPSGYVVRDLACDLERACEIADALLAMGNWSECTPQTAERFSPLIVRLKARYGNDIISNRFSTALGPVWSKRARAQASGGADHG